MNEQTASAPLRAYVSKNPGFQRAYDAYQPDEASIAKIKERMPAARLVVVSEHWCGDSRRLVPRMARILERLPLWSVEVLAWNSASRNKPLQARAIPTFIIYNGDKELGRIVESPQHGSLEEDILAIVTA